MQSRLRFICFLSVLIISVLGNCVFGQESSIDLNLADQYFKEVKALSDRDAGKLWGIPLYGPILMFDSHHFVVANQVDKNGVLKKEKNVFVGKLPNMAMGNSTLDWGGVRWATVAWPPDSDANFRNEVLIHESFHRIQDKVAPESKDFFDDHLDSLNGRFWLQLEMRALVAALSQETFHSAIEDAMIFRFYRYEIFPKAKAAESFMEALEGLANYTGIKLGRPSQDIKRVACNTIRAFLTEDTSFVRNSCYWTGTAYAVLLDLSTENWRKNLDYQQNLGDVLRKTLFIELPSNLKDEARKRSQKYDGDSLWQKEVERERVKGELIKEYRRTLVEGPVLSIPLTDQGRFSFNNGIITPIGDIGKAYSSMTVSDKWGLLKASKGILLIRENGNTRFQISAPSKLSNSLLEGNGWSLQLSPGWKAIPGSRKNDYALQKNL